MFRVSLKCLESASWKYMNTLTHTPDKTRKRTHTKKMVRIQMPKRDMEAEKVLFQENNSPY